MLAATYTRTGPAAEVLVVDHRPDPVPGPGEVLVRVHASGINPAVHEKSPARIRFTSADIRDRAVATYR